MVQGRSLWVTDDSERIVFTNLSAVVSLGDGLSRSDDRGCINVFRGGGRMKRSATETTKERVYYYRNAYSPMVKLLANLELL